MPRFPFVKPQHLTPQERQRHHQQHPPPGHGQRLGIDVDLIVEEPPLPKPAAATATAAAPRARAPPPTGGVVTKRPPPSTPLLDAYRSYRRERSIDRDRWQCQQQTPVESIECGSGEVEVEAAPSSMNGEFAVLRVGGGGQRRLVLACDGAQAWHRLRQWLNADQQHRRVIHIFPPVAALPPSTLFVCHYELAVLGGGDEASAR